MGGSSRLRRHGGSPRHVSLRVEEFHGEYRGDGNPHPGGVEGLLAADVDGGDAGRPDTRVRDDLRAVLPRNQLLSYQGWRVDTLSRVAFRLSASSCPPAPSSSSSSA